VVAAAVGDGASRTRRGLTSVLGAGPYAAVLGVGLAGALAPDLERNAVVVGTRVLDAAGGRREPDATWRDRALAAHARPGALVSAPTLVATPEAKAALRRRTGGEAVAVDLESATWADLAEDRHLPWTIVRTVSDAADEPLPGFLVRAADADGHVRPLRVVLASLRRPRRLRVLAFLRRIAREGGERLADVVERMLVSRP
jgi:nucleoside phosphorylase